MEFVGQPSRSGACNLLDVPGLGTLDVDDDEGEVVIGIRPKSSPLPRRKSSVSDDDSEPEPPTCGSRRVSFADAKGLSLVQVKEFETWDVPNLPRYDFSDGEGKDTVEYFLSLLNFSLPLSNDELSIKVQDQKVVLETIELLPETTILKGVVRVLNVSFSKAVYIRTTLDTWSSHFDLLAEYIPGSSDGQMDCFSFKLTLVPPFGEQGTRVEFCLRYETPVGTFWANNNSGNYVLLCHRGMKGQREKPQRENPNKKSCLKPVSQNLALENISAAAASSQENSSTVVSKQGEEVNTVTDQQIPPDRSGAPEDDEQKLRAENRRSSSRRGRRKAARMALLRDCLAQGDGGASGTERDGSPPEAKQAAQGETPVEEHSEMHSLAEAGSKSEGFRLVGESVGSRSKPCVLNETSQAHGYTCNGEPEKSESNSLADSATLRGAESATHIVDEPMPSSEELHNTDKSASVAEEKNLKQGMIYGRSKNIESEPADSVMSGMSGERLVSQAYSFPFGSGSENQAAGDRGSPVERDSTQSYRQTESIGSSCTVATNATSKNDRVRENLMKVRECLDATLNSPPAEEEGDTAFSLTANGAPDHAVQRRRSSSYEVPESVSGDMETYPHAGSSLTADSTESLRPQGKAQEDNMTYTLKTRATAQADEAELTEAPCSQIDTNLHATLAQTETEEDTTTVEGASPTRRPFSKSEGVSDETDQHNVSSKENVSEGLDERNTDNELGKTVTISTPRATSGEDELLEALHDLNPNHTDNSGAKESANSYAACCEIVDKDDFATHEFTTSPEAQRETDNVEERNKSSCSHEDETKSLAITEDAAEVAEPVTKADRTHGDMFVQFEDEPFIVSEKITEAAASAQGEFTLAEPTKVKIREVTGMVKEKEESALTEEEDSKAISLKAEDSETAETDFAKEREKEETIEEPVEKEAEDADVSVHNKSIEEEEVRDIVGRKKTDFEKEVEYAQATLIETINGGDKPVEESETEKRATEHCIEMRKVSIERTNAQKEKETETEEEMEIDLSGEDQADVALRDELREDNIEEDEMFVEAGEEKTADGDSQAVTLEGTEDEAGCFEERRGITQNEAERGLSAPVNNVHGPAKTHEENVARDRRDSYDSASAESDSDDEVELYMRCLRAVHTGTRARKDSETAFAVAKRPPVSKSKNLSTHMPSISESRDEEQHLSCLRDNNEDMEKLDVQAAATALSGGQEHINGHVSWWKETFSCGNTTKTLLYATSLVVFLFVAHHYDFLACFALYLASVVWLCFQGETRPGKNNRRADLKKEC